MFRDQLIQVEIAKGKWETRVKTSKFRRFAESDARAKFDLLRHASLQYSLLLAVLVPTLLAWGIHLALRPIIRIRIGILFHARVGHLAAEAELFLRHQARGRQAGKQLNLILTGTPANHQLLRMIKRRLHVRDHRLFPLLYWAMHSITGRSGMWLELPWYGDEFDEFNNIPAQLSFTQEEEECGKMLLESMGMEPGAPFVCIFARDNGYMNQAHPAQGIGGWSRHDHRNTDILNCLPAAEYLACQGIYTVRMGQVVNKALPETNPKIVDYATNHRTDFGDVYLSAKCKFFLGCNSGIIGIAQIFNVPIAWANLIPLWHLPPGKRDIFIPKELRSIELGRPLDFSEIVDSRMYEWYKAESYQQAGIEVVENSPEQILALTKEMLARLGGTWETTEEDEESQQRFRDIFPPDHFSYGFPSSIGADFLRERTALALDGNNETRRQ